MKSKIFSSFYSFVTGSARSVLFTCIFYALWLVIFLVSNEDFILRSFPQRMIGIATFEAYDVNARVTLFYKSFVLLLFSFGILNALAYAVFLRKSSLLTSPETKIVNYSSLIGIIFLLFKVFEFETFYTMELVYSMHKLMLLALFLRLVVFKNNKLDTAIYALIVTFSFLFYFLVSDCCELMGNEEYPDFFIVIFILASVFLLLIHFLLQKERSLSDRNYLNKLFYAAVPLGFLPLLSVAKIELFFIFKNNGISLAGALLPYILCLCILILLIIIRAKKFWKIALVSPKALLIKRYFPFFIFSLVSFTYYKLYFNYSGESFESANKYLAIMEFKLFGVIPTLEKFNSHLLSDYFFSAIYTFFNGMGSVNEIELYDFMYVPFSVTLFYCLIYFITRNGFIAVFSVLLFPFYTSMFPGGYSFSIPGIFALHLILAREQSFKNYLILFYSIVGMVLWRFDLGYPCMIITPVILLAYNFLSRDFRINWGLLLKSLSFVLASLVLFLGLLSVYRHINLFAKSLYILNYFTSAQTYGYSTLGWTNMPSYTMDYFVFPACVGLIIIALVLNFRSLNVSKKQRLAYLSLLFICCYYVINFNRGLVRHSLIEWIDDFNCSFVYIILPGSVFVFFHKQNTIFKFIVFFLISFFSIINYKLPVPKGSVSLMQGSIAKIQTSTHEDLLKIESRIKGTPPPEDFVDIDLLKFMKQNTTAEETFIDFTGSSLMYYYTQKITPSFFFQNPICSHNEFLQKHFIEDLKDYKTPYLLFSSISENFYDGVDGVPNSLRNYRMVEYFYKNFEPHLVLGHLRVWKKKGLKDKSRIDTLYNYSIKNRTAKDSEIISPTIHFKDGKKYLLRIDMNNDLPAALKVCFEKDTLRPAPYKVSTNVGYYILETKWPSVNLILNDTSHNCNSFMVLECDYLPDFYSEQYLTYDFKKLPYIWGTYDKEQAEETILFEKKINTEINNSLPFSMDIPDKLDKSSGNSVLISCKNTGEKIQNLTILFGKKGLKDRSSITFNVLPSDKIENYVIRVSSVYKWVNAEVNEITITTDADKSITLETLRVTKAN